VTRPALAGMAWAAVILAALAGCASSSPATAAATAGQTVTAAPLTPLQKCTAIVTGLLGQTQTAVEQGYSGGISTTAVEEQYGVQSAVWQAFWTLDAQELAWFAENGTASGDPPQLLQVPQACEAYGA
jgi:hypothetical protein